MCVCVNEILPAIRDTKIFEKVPPTDNFCRSPVEICNDSDLVIVAGDSTNLSDLPTLLIYTACVIKSTVYFEIFS